jgi:hypothetical protein
MREIAFFVEDFAHQEVLKALVRRLADQREIQLTMNWRNARRGHGAVISELKQYLRDLQRGQGNLPDLLVIGTDANCKGLAERRRQITDLTRHAGIPTVCAVPDPHIERWLLVDSAAFMRALGKGCAAPDQKCERSRYKRLLAEAIRATGITPSLGGIEFSEDIVDAMDLESLGRKDASLDQFLDDLKSVFTGWRA